VHSGPREVLGAAGLPWFDSKRWYDHTSDEWARAQYALSDLAKNAINNIGWIGAIGKVGFAALGAVIVSRADCRVAGIPCHQR
jgi:hypothetical protein